jgi:uncharacterized protein DUF5681
MDNEPDPNYEVGYGKPPRHTRFKKGESGRTRARLPQAKSMATSIANALNEPVRVNDKGRRRTISKREAVLVRLVNRAASGDCRAIHLVLRAVRGIEERPPGPVFSLDSLRPIRRQIDERERLEREEQARRNGGESGQE